MSLKFVIALFWLKTGVTFTIFLLLGKFSGDIDSLNIFISGWFMKLYTHFATFTCNTSDPWDLLL